MADKSLRTWHLLRLIPRHPRRKTPSELQVALRDAGFDLTLRSIQRDLNDLSSLWGITCDLEGSTNHWYWPVDARLFDIPNIGSAEALVFLLAKEYLKDILPFSQMNLLRPYFIRAEELIGKEHVPVFRWHKRVRVIQQGPTLKVPDVQTEVVKEVHEALLHERRVSLHYQRRGEKTAKDYLLSPQALVLRQGVMYLVATANDYKDLLHFALHRASSAKLVEQPATKLKSFDLDHYLETEKAFAYPSKSDALISLRLAINEGLAFHLSERPLSTDQVMRQTESGSCELSAQVADTEDLRWWLLGLGSAVAVIEPPTLKREIKSRLMNALKGYA